MAANFIYHPGLQALLNGTIDLLTDTIKAALLDDGHVPDRDDEFFSDVSADEVSATGYTAGGFALTGKTLVDIGSGTKFDAEDYSFAELAAGADFRFIVLYDDSVANDPLIALIDCEPRDEEEQYTNNPVPNGGLYRIVWSSEGLLKFANYDEGS